MPVSGYERTSAYKRMCLISAIVSVNCIEFPVCSIVRIINLPRIFETQTGVKLSTKRSLPSAPNLGVRVICKVLPGNFALRVLS